MYDVTVNDDWTVTVKIDGNQVDHCGPWSTLEGAQLWAAAILADLEANVDSYRHPEA